MKRERTAALLPVLLIVCLPGCTKKPEPSAERATPVAAEVITNSIGMKLTLIPAGEFMMGSAGFGAAKPQHRVRITKPFFLGICHVTRGQFRQFVADTGYQTDSEKAENPGAVGWQPGKKQFAFGEKYSWRDMGFGQTDDHPVVNVSWNDATAYCEWLSGKEEKTYRLPTEAEWEYACRAGTTTLYYSGDDRESLAEVGNVSDATHLATFPDWEDTIMSSDGYVFTAPVGKFPPNAFGLYDMHGNAAQWCADWHSWEYYAASPKDDPTGPATGHGRVVRGSSFNDGPGNVRSDERYFGEPDDGLGDVGFRVARTK